MENLILTLENKELAVHLRRILTEQTTALNGFDALLVDNLRKQLENPTFNKYANDRETLEEKDDSIEWDFFAANAPEVPQWFRSLARQKIGKKWSEGAEIFFEWRKYYANEMIFHSRERRKK